MKLKTLKPLFILLFFLTVLNLSGQDSLYSNFYRVYLSDKGNLNYNPEELLSERAILRREKAGVIFPDFKDFPVYKPYLEQIADSGFVLHSTSKWMNTALFKTIGPEDPSRLLELPFVRDVRTVKTTVNKGKSKDKVSPVARKEDLPSYDTPLTMLNGLALHNSGYNGRNVLIAVLDAGFTNADKIESLGDLRNRNGIKGIYNFLKRNNDVYSSDSHGTAVLSVLAGDIPGYITGTAPGADYLLLLTEDVRSEFPCEEDFWAAGAEFADSSGADIISSSLGYYNFDDPSLDYKISDLDGNTAFITKVADIAASKGILVVNSAGNERNNLWKKIIFPSDGDSVLAAGAVDENRTIATFSSAGPASDNRIKPDNSAMGVSVPVQTIPGYISRANGTSFSCPVLSGMAACLIQAIPKALNTDIIEAFHKSADRYNSPDSLYGYGIPDMVSALSFLEDRYITIPVAGVTAWPNPTSGIVQFIFEERSEKMIVEIISMSGKILYREDMTPFAGRTLVIDELQHREQGIYFIRLTIDSGVSVHKIIKLDY